MIEILQTKSANNKINFQETELKMKKRRNIKTPILYIVLILAVIFAAARFFRG